MNLAVVSFTRRLAEDISVDMIAVVCGADHDGILAIKHPITKIKYEFPAKNDTIRPIISIANEIM